MISYNHRIKFHVVHQFDHRFTLKKICPVISLDHITCRKQQGGPLFAKLFDLGGKIGNTTDPLLRSDGLIWLSKFMKIIDMKNPDLKRFTIPKCGR